MIFKRTKLAILGLCFCAVVSAPKHAAAQTPDLLAAADRLIAVQDVDATMRDMATKIAATLPGFGGPQQRVFVTEMNSAQFLGRYKSFLRISMAQNMSIEEMNAMSDFYSKPIAKSAMHKMGSVMAGIMPFIQTEIPGIVARVMNTP